jgi:hypothetical protein
LSEYFITYCTHCHTGKQLSPHRHIVATAHIPHPVIPIN